MAKARVERVSGYGMRDKTVPPHPEAILVDEGRKFINTGEPITHWEIEINSLEDLTRISGEERVILTFNADGVASITFYDDYLE